MYVGRYASTDFSKDRVHKYSCISLIFSRLDQSLDSLAGPGPQHAAGGDDVLNLANSNNNNLNEFGKPRSTSKGPFSLL
jgi:hypothetical protein